MVLAYIYDISVLVAISAMVVSVLATILLLLGLSGFFASIPLLHMGNQWSIGPQPLQKFLCKVEGSA